MCLAHTGVWGNFCVKLDKILVFPSSTSYMLDLSVFLHKFEGHSINSSINDW